MKQPAWVVAAQMKMLCQRRVSVDLQDGVSFRVTEVLGVPRPNHWARVWPTAVAMSRWLMDLPDRRLPASALELGCGVGLLSMVLGQRGVPTRGTDREPLALACATLNARDHGHTAFTSHLLDWSEPCAQPPSAFVVASDILYEPNAAAALLRCLHRGGLLSPGGRLVMGIPAARALPMQHLLGRLSRLGYTHRVEQRVESWNAGPEGIDIHTLIRPVLPVADRTALSDAA